MASLWVVGCGKYSTIARVALAEIVKLKQAKCDWGMEHLGEMLEAAS
jgi:hypothetical protein